MSLSWQKNSLSTLLGTWSDISTFQVDEGTGTVTLAVNETDGKARTAKLWAACFENKAPADSENRHGKELATEGWLEVSLHGAATWQALTFPTSFPVAFADLNAGEGAFEFTVAASGRTLLDFRLVVPAGATSGGMLLHAPVMRCVDA